MNIALKDAVQEAVDVHYRHGGSKEAKLLNCPSHNNIADQAPDIDRESADAQRGTALHKIMELYYDDDDPDLDALCADLSPEDREQIDIAVAATEAVLDKYGIEEVVCEPLIEIAADEGGSPDMLACSPEVFLVVDYKFGRVPVEAVTPGLTVPEQLLFYLMAVEQSDEEPLHLTELMYEEGEDCKRLVGVIIQPQVKHSAIEYEISFDEFESFLEKHDAAIMISRSGSTEHANPGVWCKYCPGEPGYCEAKRKDVQKYLKLDPTNSEELDAAAGLLDQMKEQTKAVEREMMNMLEAGRQVTGFKLVAKQARRHWVDALDAMQTFKRSRLKGEVYLEDPVLRSPAQMEKAVKRAGKKYDIESMVTKSSSGHTYAPESDEREAIVPLTSQVPDAISAILDDN